MDLKSVVRAVLWCAVVLAISVVGASAEVASTKSNPKITDLVFMSGCWEGDLGGGTTMRETYTAPNAGVILGNGQVVSGGETRFFEFSQIRETAEGITYRPFPAGKGSVAFSLVSLSADQAVFENPDHDAPQRIRYSLVEGKHLVAEIEQMDGSQGQRFEMKAVPCGGEAYDKALVARDP